MKSLVLMMIILVAGGLFSCTKEAVEAPSPERFALSELTTEAGLENTTFNLVNDFRKSRDLPSLVFNEETYNLALDHSRYMAGKGLMSHANFSERAQYLGAKVNATLVAENLSRNYPTAEETLKGWLESPNHRSTLLDEAYTHTAVAVVSTPDGEVYYTQIFLQIAED